MNDVPKYDMSDDGPDFGEDADVVPPTDADFDAWVTKAAPALNAPPVTPRLHMWNAIQRAQQTAPVPLRRARWYWPAAVAAALLVGIGIDRYAMRPAAETDGTLAGPRAASTTPTPSRLYRLAAVQTLTQAEALLTAYRAGNVSERNPDAARQLGTWGREVLGSTRLLLDSPAGDDPQLRPLLNDIELVLVQIIRLSGAPLDSSDRALINGAMRDRDLLPRIRTAVPAGVAGAASDD